MSSPSLANSLDVNPLFYDALSGEFTPNGQSRTYKLGRLAVVAYEIGKMVRPEDPNFGNLDNPLEIIALDHSPAWASSVTARVFCSIGVDRVNFPRGRIFGLSLINSEGSLSFREMPGPKGSDARVLAMAGSLVQASEVALDSHSANQTQRLITQAAQSFFEHVH